MSPAYTVIKKYIDISDGYYRRYFKTEEFISKLNSTIYGIRDGKQIGYDDFCNIYLHIPPLPEQEKIAEILSTWERAIELKDILIFEKKQQKKWLMQNLLTGQNRLPGFTGDWQQKKLGDIVRMLTDYVANGSFESLRNNVVYLDDGYAVLIRLQDYSNKFNGPFIYIDEKAYCFLEKSKVFEKDIIISNVGAGIGTTFRAPKLDKPMSLAPNTILLRTKENDDFIFYWLQSDIGYESINEYCLNYCTTQI